MAAETEGKPRRPAGAGSVKKSSTRKTTPRSATSKAAPAGKPRTTASSKRSPASGAAKRKRTATVTLPFVTAEFRMPEVHLPNVRVPQPNLPPREQLTHAARLGAGAVVGLIEWPAAASVATIRYLAKRAGSGGASRRQAVRKPTT